MKKKTQYLRILIPFIILTVIIMNRNSQTEPQAYKITSMRPVENAKVYTSAKSPVTSLGDSIEILTWNCHKKGDDLRWRHELEHLQSLLSPSILLLQEIDFQKSTEEYLSQLPLHFNFFPNLQLNTHALGGVATLSPATPIENFGVLSEVTEPFLRTKKLFLLSSYMMENGEILTVINLHGINFVKTSSYINQMDQIKEQIEKCTGSVIVAGDFNAWSHKRQKVLKTLFSSFPQFQFKEVSFFDHTEHVKKAPRAIQSFFGEHHLDRIFYSSSSLALDEESVMAHHQIHEEKFISSDHLPLSCRFTAIPKTALR